MNHRDHEITRQIASGAVPAVFTKAQEDRIREIIAEMIASFSAGADERIHEVVCISLASAIRVADARKARREAQLQALVSSVHGEASK